jgi:hypothetical protein
MVEFASCDRWLRLASEAVTTVALSRRVGSEVTVLHVSEHEFTSGRGPVTDTPTID